MEAQAHNSLEPPHGSNSPFLKGGLTLPKIQRKGEMEKLLEGRGNPKKGGFWKKGGMLLVWVFFLARVWQV